MTESDPTTWKVIEHFEADHPELAAASDFFRRNFFDSFMDVLGNYIDWREGGKKPNSFLNRQLKNWGINSWIGEHPASTIRKMMASEGIQPQINDEATISAALAEMFYDRKVVTADRKKALVCIERQSSEIVLRHLRYHDIDQAKKDFDRLRAVIASKPG